MATRRSKAKAVQSFYGEALDAADREDLPVARNVDGLDEEIAVLRLKLRQALEEHPENIQLMAKGMEILVRAVNARYRLSRESRDDLADNLAGVLRGVGQQLFPEGFHDD